MIVDMCFFELCISKPIQVRKLEQLNICECLLQQMMHGTHYIGEDMLAHFGEGETWRKVFGPFFVYLNSTADLSNAHNLWIDAKNQVLKFVPTFWLQIRSITMN